MTAKKKVTVYLSEDVVTEIQAEGNRLERSLSWVLQKLWTKGHPSKEAAPHLTLVILRGLPGGGKSTAVKVLLGELAGSLVVSGPQEAILQKLEDKPTDFACCSADDFFVGDDGVYRFDGRKIGMAHSQCQTKALAAMGSATRLVIVDNTHTTAWEYALYEEMGRIFQYETVILDVFDGGRTDEELAARNSHGVPLAAIQAMRSRYENGREYLSNEVVVTLDPEM